MPGARVHAWTTAIAAVLAASLACVTPVHASDAVLPTPEATHPSPAVIERPAFDLGSDEDHGYATFDDDFGDFGIEAPDFGDTSSWADPLGQDSGEAPVEDLDAEPASELGTGDTAYDDTAYDDNAYIEEEITLTFQGVDGVRAPTDGSAMDVGDPGDKGVDLLITNTTSAPLVDPTVVNPDGSELVLEGVTLLPDQSFEYDIVIEVEAGETVLFFEVYTEDAYGWIECLVRAGADPSTGASDDTNPPATADGFEDLLPVTGRLRLGAPRRPRTLPGSAGTPVLTPPRCPAPPRAHHPPLPAGRTCLGRAPRTPASVRGSGSSSSVRGSSSSRGAGAERSRGAGPSPRTAVHRPSPHTSVRSTVFWIFPVPERGKASLTTRSFGSLYRASLPSQNARISSRVGASSSACGTIIATGTSPHFGSLRPTTATSATFGCQAMTFSSSAQ